jgi:NADH-quinone oxidoreductase subunit J
VLYTDYALPFQLAAVVLLVAIVAAITLTMRRRPGYKQQDVVAQVATRKEDRLRIMKVEPEKRR